MSGIGNVTGRSDINQVLAEMRNMRNQIQRPEEVRPEVSPNKIQPSQEVQETPSFSDVLSNAVNSVNDLSKQSGELKTAYEQGDPNVSISQVMVQSQKASVAFDALTQVRNKVVKAYEDIMNMPV